MSTIKTRKHSKEWVPVRNGVYYCSPRCGGGKYCLWEWYQDACAKATELAQRMGPQWVTEVYENLGWHYRVECGEFTITPAHKRDDIPQMYLAQYKHTNFYASASTPEEALGQLKHDMRTHIHNLQDDLRALEDD